MRFLVVAVSLATVGCNTVTAQCELELQVTDHPEAKYRSRKICKAEGFEGTLEKTLCRSKERLDGKNLPASCK